MYDNFGFGISFEVKLCFISFLIGVSPYLVKQGKGIYQPLHYCRILKGDITSVKL